MTVLIIIFYLVTVFPLTIISVITDQLKILPPNYYAPNLFPNQGRILLPFILCTKIKQCPGIYNIYMRINGTSLVHVLNVAMRQRYASPYSEAYSVYKND